MTVDLKTTYLGLELRSPLVAAASPLSGDLETLQQLEAAGAAAVVMKSLFEEQIEHEAIEAMRMLDFATESVGEALTWFPELENYNTGPTGWLEHVERCRQHLKIPVIGSLNGASPGGWTRYARRLEDTGIDALELNIYYVAAEPGITGAEVENRYIELVESVCKTISIPVAVKIGPYFSSVSNMARRLTEAGAAGIVIFNRFIHPDIDLGTMEVVANMEMSSPSELRQTLRWIAILRGRIPSSLAASTGAHRATDVIKLLLAGADVVQMASALLQRGPGWIGKVQMELEEWLSEEDYESVEQMKGSLCARAADDPAAYERAHYMKALVRFSQEMPRS